MFYDDYKQDSIIFTRRIQHLVNHFKIRGIECNIEIPQTIAVSVNGDIINESIQHNGDHVRGERDRNSTNDSKAKTIVHLKPKNIHGCA
jgi:sulfur carrier protein ThiS